MLPRVVLLLEEEEEEEKRPPPPPPWPPAEEEEDVLLLLFLLGARRDMKLDKAALALLAPLGLEEEERGGVVVEEEEEELGTDDGNKLAAGASSSTLLKDGIVVMLLLPPPPPTPACAAKVPIPPIRFAKAYSRHSLRACRHSAARSSDRHLNFIVPSLVSTFNLVASVIPFPPTFKLIVNTLLKSNVPKIDPLLSCFL